MYPCPFCKLTLIDSPNFLRHAKLKHNSELFMQCECPYSCAGKFNSIYSYKKHLVAKHIPAENSANKNLTVNVNLESANLHSTEVHSLPLLSIQNNIDVNPNQFENQVDNPDASISNYSVNLQEFENSVATDAMILVSQLYSNSNIPRAHVHKILTSVNNFYKTSSIDIVKDTLSKNIDSASENDNVIKMLEITENAFADFNTEHKTFSVLEKTGCFIKPMSIPVDACLKPCSIQGETQIHAVEKTIQVIPLDILLKQFLELSNVFDSIMTNIENIKKSSYIISLLQGTVWQDIEKNMEDKLVLPLVLYFDDFEINNPLGSHKKVHKLGAVYCTIPCIPNEYSSMLENIFLWQVHNTVDHESIGNKRTFANIKEQIFNLENKGIVVNINGVEKRIYFVVSAILGDNLGLNTILGFSKSFNAKYFCRICLATIEDCKTLVKKNSELLRTEENYNKHSSSQTFGVKEECIFNFLPNFKVTKNVTIDPMHDLPLGLCRDEVPRCLKELIFKEKFFTVDLLNSRLAYIKHRSPDINCPTSIDVESIKNEHLILTASEMLFIVHNLGLIIGDRVPSSNKAWQVFTMLRKIVSLAMAPTLTKETIDYFSELVEKHHSLYIEVFKTHLKPKHHMLTHYARIMILQGPTKFLSCMRFEAKNKELKEFAEAVESRKNPGKTVAIKHQLSVCNRLLTKTGFPKRLEKGVCSALQLSTLPSYFHFKKSLPPNFTDTQTSVSWVRVNGTFYSPHMVVALDHNYLFPLFGKIQLIIVTESNDVFFIFTNLNTISSNDHLQAFEVFETDTWGIISQKNIIDFLPCAIHSLLDGKKFVPHF